MYEWRRIETSCKYPNDYVVCGDEYLYLRYVVPSPVNDLGRDCFLAVRAQMSPNNLIKFGNY